MNIFSRRKKPEFNQLDKGCVVEMYLDESLIRMCLKYEIHAEIFMRKALLDEVHNQSLLRESVYFGGYN